MTMSDRAVTVLTRFHDVERLGLLDEALFSLLGQNTVSVKSRVLCQQLNDDDFARVDTVCRIYRELGLDVVATNERFDRKADHRAELLNRGIARVDTRFLAFLDSDDIVYPSCYTRLIERIEITGAAIAFGGVLRCDYIDALGHVFARSKYRIFQGLPKARFFLNNQYPIHSFVIDMNVVDRKAAYFDPSATHCEDYAFLFRLLRAFKYDDKECDRPSCEYRINLDGGNSFEIDQDSATAREVRHQVDEYIAAIKKEGDILISYQDLVALIDYQESIAAEGAAQAVRSTMAPAAGVPMLRDDDVLRQMLLKRVDSPENRRLLCHVDRVTQLSDGRHLVEGWCAGGRHRPLAVKLVAVSREARSFVSRFHEREDVSRLLSSDDLDFGFAAYLARMKNFAIIALCADGNIYQSAPLSTVDGKPSDASSRTFVRGVMGAIRRRREGGVPAGAIRCGEKGTPVSGAA